tara:strand:- start:23275 stop:24099 length:825 start_codon:yes stop_codon:yes gene_type:complete
MNIDNHVNKIKSEGYSIIENLISPEECDQYVDLLEKDNEKFSKYYANKNSLSSSSLSDKSREKVVYNLHNKNLKWFNLFENSTIIKILDILLKSGSYKNSEPYNLLNISARSPQINGNKQQLHLDSNLPGGSYPLIIVVLWMLEDFSIENGATRIVPGSHKFNSYAEDNKTYNDEIIIQGKRGSALVFDGSLWHGGGTNKSTKTRWGLVLGYGRWFIKPSFDLLANTPPEIYDNLTDAQKALLGFNSAPPLDEFTRLTRRSPGFETSINKYKLP